LASIAAAWSLGIPLDTIRARAESIAADIDKVPGRFNVLEIEGATVVVDYGHNTHSLAAVIEALNMFPHPRRTCVYSTAGDRRNCDIIRQGELLGAAFDRVILYEDHYRRGRTQGEIVGLFRQGLESATRSKEIIEVVGATKAAEVALSSAQPGELVLLQADTIDETVHWLRGYLEALAAKAAPDVIEQVLGEPAEQPALAPASVGAKASEAITPAEVETAVLAESHAAAKV
jgi:cyanophycin synthetase